MTGQIALQSCPESASRRQPLLPPRRSVSSYARDKKASVGECVGSAATVLSPARDRKAKVGECAGSAAADCASIFCCCPFVVAEFLVIAVYKLPTAICRRIWRKLLLRKRLMKKKKMSGGHPAVRDSGRMSTIHCFDDKSAEPVLNYFEAVKVSIDGSAEVVDLDREMWERFHNSGFGRSLSQRHSDANFEVQ